MDKKLLSTQPKLTWTQAMSLRWRVASKRKTNKWSFRRLCWTHRQVYEKKRSNSYDSSLISQFTLNCFRTEWSLIISKKCDLIWSRHRCDIPPIFNMVKSVVMSLAKLINNTHDSMKKHGAGKRHKIVAINAACRPIMAMKKPNGVLQLNGNLNDKVKKVVITFLSI